MNARQEVLDDEAEDGVEVAPPDINALTQLNAAEINQQIMTARAYPRSITAFRRSMREMVTYDEPTALSCLYALKRGKKAIEGPSIRFAEAAVQAWGNARVGARIVEQGESFITAQGFFYDLEKNMAIAFEVMRRITTSEGHRFNDDMIGVTGNAACSIALRNAILKGIPRTAWDEPYEAARRLSVGKGEGMSAKREGMIKAFAPLEVDKEQIFGLLGVKGIEDVSVEHLILMNGILNAIKNGDETVESAFALENMVNADEAAPPRPKQSAFTRKEPTKESVAPTAAAHEQKADGQGAFHDEREASPPTDQQTKVEKTETLKEQLDRERKVFVRDANDQLKWVTKVRDIPALFDRVIGAGVMSEAEEKHWEAACDARSKEIVTASKAKK